MKNIFLVVNKEKVYAYAVSILTIVTLFFMSSIMSSDEREIEQTSSNAIENTIMQNIVNDIENNQNVKKIDISPESLEVESNTNIIEN